MLLFANKPSYVVFISIMLTSLLNNVQAETSQPHNKLNNKQLMAQGMYQDVKGLVWMRCALGQTWKNNTCTGTAIESNWAEATKLAANNNFAGRNNWRLPSITELHSLISCNKGFTEKIKLPYTEKQSAVFNYKEVSNLCNENSTAPTLNRTVYPNVPVGIYWSSTIDHRRNGFAWYTYFGGGYSHYYNASSKNYTLLVSD